MTRTIIAAVTLLTFVSAVSGQTTIPNPVRVVTSPSDLSTDRQLLSAIQSLNAKIDNLAAVRSVPALPMPAYAATDCGHELPMTRSIRLPQTIDLPTVETTSFIDPPVIDIDNDMNNAKPRVIHVDGRPHLILDPEPVGLCRRLFGNLIDLLHH